MSRRMPGTGLDRRRMVLAIRTVKAAATAAVAGTAIVLTLGGATANPAGTSKPDHEAPRSTEASVRLAEGSTLHEQCAGAGGQAVVLTAKGETRTVPFERGWRIYRGERPGTLLAVCPD